MMRILYSVLFVSTLVVGAYAHAAGCPAIDGIPDFNCDGKVEITYLGDSLVYGFADTKNGNKGGYVLRIAKAFKNVQMHNWGVQGERTLNLVSQLIDAFDKGNNDSLKEDLLASDIVFIDVGRNDRWLFGEPSAAYRNIKRATTKIINEVKAVNGAAPLVVKAVLMLPNRGSQGPWVKVLNQLILNSNSANYPADLRFDLVSKRLLSSDQIHPTSAGYDALAKTLKTYLTKSIPKKMKAIRPDADNDDIFDLFETLKFNTDPTKADTDGDGKTDGYEVFVSKTDPLVVD